MCQPCGHGYWPYGCGPFFRRFISTKERVEWLEEYRDRLKEELVGAEERIQELKGSKKGGGKK